ncbi:MAG: class I SAM-dependent methyltransferase [Lachnospiraceae bacterium]|nr:class I SAM-dependent methyltransferase [Lachnospiraceae bacterium]
MAQENITTNLDSWNRWDKEGKYSKWIYHMYEKYVGKNILDVGGGIGTAISFYIKNVDRVIATELFDNQIDIMNKRFQKYPYFKALKLDIMKDDLSELAPFDTIVCINVLEHIEDDTKALVNMKRLLTEKGKIVVCVPAIKRLYCYMDKNVGHYRRYEKGELRKKAEKVKLRVLEDKYMNLMGVMPYWMKGKFGKDKGGSFSTSIDQSESKLYYIASLILEPLERFIKVPIGISEIIILSKE